MQTVVILIHLMIVLAMVGLVLIQKSEGGGLGMGGGGGGGFMSNRGTANVLTRATGILAALFFATSLFLSILASYDRKPRSILEAAAPPRRPARRRFRQPGNGRRAQPARRRNAAAGAGGSGRTVRAAGSATVKLPKGRGTGPSLLGEVRCEDVETNFFRRQNFSRFSTARAGLHGTFPPRALVESIRRD